jgi:hypothetical protein
MMQMATSATTLSATYREAAGLLCRLLMVESVVLGIDDDFSKAEAHRRCVRQFVPLQDDAAKPVFESAQHIHRQRRTGRHADAE